MVELYDNTKEVVCEIFYIYNNDNRFSSSCFFTYTRQWSGKR